MSHGKLDRISVGKKGRPPGRRGLKSNPSALETPGIVVSDGRSGPSRQEPCFHEDLKSVADAKDEPTSVMKAPKRIVEGLEPSRQNATGAQVISIAEPAGDGQDLEGIERPGTLQNSVDVGRLNVSPSKLPGRDGFLIAVCTRSPKDDRTGQGHGSTGKKAN